DALPIHEESGVDFHSRTDGRMHACGHDAHMAIMLGVARTLIDRIWDVNGKYLFVFQPAEEIVEGAKAMIARGLLEQQRPDVVVGLHIVSFMESGTVVTRPGLLWAGSDAFDVKFSGPGGHGGMMGRRGNVLAAQAFFVERGEGTVPRMNEPNVTGKVLEVGDELIGDRASVLGRPLTVSDDFAEFLTRIPGCYFMLGARPEGDTPPAHHSPGFRIDESALPVGVKVLAGAASRLAAE